MKKNNSSTKIENTGERMVPEYDKGGLVYAEHIVRYKAAQDIVRGKEVLDIACGAGYGTRMLSETAKHIYGVDIDPKAVDYAKKTYGTKNTTFLNGSGTDIPLDDNSVDVVITFETIEHIQQYEKFISELKRVLRHDGILIVSTPNDLEFAEGNHFHVHEFEYKELKSLMQKNFKNVDSYYQGTWKYVAVGEEAIFSEGFEGKIDTTNLSPQPINKRLYFYLICSNREITEKVYSTAAIGEHYSERANLEASNATNTHIRNLNAAITECKQTINELRKNIEDIQKSKSYRLARKFARARNVGKK